MTKVAYDTWIKALKWLEKKETLIYIGVNSNIHLDSVKEYVIMI